VIDQAKNIEEKKVLLQNVIGAPKVLEAPILSTSVGNIHSLKEYVNPNAYNPTCFYQFQPNQLCKIAEKFISQPDDLQLLREVTSLQIDVKLITWFNRACMNHLLDLDKNNLSTFPQLRRLELGRINLQLDDDRLQQFLSSHQHLTHLNLYGCQKITDRSLQTIGERCPFLENLDLTLCQKITDGGLKHIVTHCKNLKCLILGSPLITGIVQWGEKETPAFFNLTCLNLEHCLQMNDEGLLLFTTCYQNLKYIRLGHCPVTKQAIDGIIQKCHPHLIQFDFRQADDLGFDDDDLGFDDDDLLGSDDDYDCRGSDNDDNPFGFGDDDDPFGFGDDLDDCTRHNRGKVDIGIIFPS
jgi:hypothetical protein